MPHPLTQFVPLPRNSEPRLHRNQYLKNAAADKGHLITGTTRYFGDAETTAQSDEHAGLKCDTSGPVPIILVCNTTPSTKLCS
jgi:hypothetical protein